MNMNEIFCAPINKVRIRSLGHQFRSV